ncbi:MAG: anti-sigma factor antagonist [Ruminococcus sp.]|nr:anti-sigma factor antagonist [Ruminococcus sp.]
MLDNQKSLLTIPLTGRVDSNNAGQVEQQLLAALKNHAGSPVVIYAAELKYISSAGLRILLRIKKNHPDLTVTDVNPEVYEIFEMTGFTEIMKIEKAYRRVSVDGCEVIGEGANGKVYRIDRDMVVKTYKNTDALAEIQHEREVARTALVLGIPTAISYDVVKVGDGYGSVFELLDASSFAKIIAEQPQRFDWCVAEYVKMLRHIHETVVPEGKLPSIMTTVRQWLDGAVSLLPQSYGEKLKELIDALPERDTMIHGDYHTKNIVLADNEVLLIDMDTLSVGHPIFEFAQMYNSYIGFGEYDPEIIARFQGYPSDVANKFWRRSLGAYLETDDEKKIDEAEEKIRCVAYTRLIDWGRRHFTSDSKKRETVLPLWVSELVALLDKVDSLEFLSEPETAYQELVIDADPKNLLQVQDFIEQQLARNGCHPKTLMHIGVAVEEVFSNIAQYAYLSEKGTTTVRVEVTHDPVSVVITFMDHGVPYDPLIKKDPNVTLSADDRNVGGLGIFLTKKTMDDIVYEYKDGQNILTLKKTL